MVTVRHPAVVGSIGAEGLEYGCVKEESAF